MKLLFVRTRGKASKERDNVTYVFLMSKVLLLCDWSKRASFLKWRLYKKRRQI